MSQSDINKVRRSVGMNIGSKVKIRAIAVDIRLTSPKEPFVKSYPSIFLVEIVNDLDSTTQDSFLTATRMFN